MRILAADDELVSRLAMEDVLRQCGEPELVLADDGASAWQRMSGDQYFDLICLDVRMPPPDGLELVARLRAAPALKRVPAMLIMQVQARIDSAHGRFPEAIAGLTKIVEFYDGRGMAVAPLVRALNFRADAQLGKGDADAAMADARRALEISRRLQGDKPWSSLTGQSLLTIARIQENRGDHEAARVAAKEALPHLRETLSPEHPDARRAAQFSAD